ncbi:MAG: type IV pilus biogenesis/stability protein PilW [Pseudomonadota bacterium]
MKRWALSILLVIAMVSATSGCVTEEYGRVTKESPDDAAAYNYQLGVEYLKQGKLQQARDRLESSVSQNPDNAAAHFTLAILYERINETNLAERSYRNAIRVAPDDGAVQNSYAIHLCGRGRYSDARKYFERAANNPLYGTPAAALTNAGVCMLEGDDDAAAERYFRQALAIRANYSEALLQLAALKYSTGNALSARAFLQRLFDANDPTAETLLLAWRVEKQLGDDIAAQDFAATLLEQFPQSPEAARLNRGS